MLQIATLILLLVVVWAQGDNIGDFTLEHAIGSAPFTVRGRVRMEKSPNTGVVDVKVEKSTLNDIQALENAALTGDAYRVRLRSDGADGPWVVASLDACTLVASSMMHEIIFHLSDSGQNGPISVGSLSLLAPRGSFECPADEKARMNLIQGGIAKAKDGDAVKLLLRPRAELPEESGVLPLIPGGPTSPYPGQNPHTPQDMGSDSAEKPEEPKGILSMLQGWMWPILIGYAVLSFLGGGDDQRTQRRRTEN